MDIVHCAICSDLLQSVKFDLKSTNSKHSHTPLISLVERAAGTLFSIYFNICVRCYNLINELDAIELRQIEIHNQFKNYLVRNKQEVSLDCKEEIENITEINTTEDAIIDDINNINSCNESDKNDFNKGVGSNKEIYNLTDNNIEEYTKNENEIKPLIDMETGFEPSVKKKGKRKKYPDIAKPHKCHCSKEFRTLGELKNHMNSHSDYRPFICDICGQSYKHKAAFNIHVDMHNGINPFTCVYCSKSFTQKGALVRHVPIHTGEKLYQCDECGKRFIHRTSFSIHRLSHSGQKSYKCNLCGLALMSGSHLKRHMRIHTGEKKFGCSTCGKRFAEKYNLAVHEKLHFNSESGLSQKTKYSSQASNITTENMKQIDTKHIVNSN